MKLLPKRILCTLCAAALPLLSLSAGAADDTDTADAEKTNGRTVGAYWIGTFATSPQGSICVRLSEITSVSIHNYMLNGKIPIGELTIDTTGNNSIRIYCVLSAEDMSKEVLSMVSSLKSETSSLGSVPQVAKQFPEGTHAHSIEYSVDSEAQLKAIYASIVKAMMSNKNGKMAIK